MVTAISIGRWLQAITLSAFSEVGYNNFSRAEKVVLDIMKAKHRMYRRYLQQWVYKKGIDGELFARVISSLSKNGHLGEGKEITASGHERTWVEYIPQAASSQLTDNT
jgi:hypothetical protein